MSADAAASWSRLRSARDRFERLTSGCITIPVIYAELCFGFATSAGVEEVVARFGLLYEEIPRSGLFKAAKAFRAYKFRSGTKRSVLPDFFVGGHGETTGMPVLTRDIGRLQTVLPVSPLDPPEPVARLLPER